VKVVDDVALMFAVGRRIMVTRHILDDHDVSDAVSDDGRRSKVRSRFRPLPTTLSTIGETDTVETHRDDHVETHHDDVKRQKLDETVHVETQHDAVHVETQHDDHVETRHERQRLDETVHVETRHDDETVPSDAVERSSRVQDDSSQRRRRVHATSESSRDVVVMATVQQQQQVRDGDDISSRARSLRSAAVTSRCHGDDVRRRSRDARRHQHGGGKFVVPLKRQ